VPLSYSLSGTYMKKPESGLKVVHNKENKLIKNKFKYQEEHGILGSGQLKRE